MKDTKDYRHTRSYAFGSSLHERLQKLANQHTDGNRSRMAEELIEAGILAIIHPKEKRGVDGTQGE